MSASPLHIERWRSHYSSAEALSAEQVSDWQAGLHALDAASLYDGLLSSEQWLLIRHLPVQARWRADSAERDIHGAWSSALRQALSAALADPQDGNVVAYANRRQAWADLLYRAALGDGARDWAWVTMGLLPRVGLPAAAQLDAACSALAHESTLIWPVLHQLIAAEGESAAFSALLTGLPRAAWFRLLQAAPQTAPYVLAANAVPDAAKQLGAEAVGVWPEQAQCAVLLRWMKSRPSLAMQHAEVLAVLLAATAWPTAGVASRILRQRYAQALEYCWKGLPARAVAREFSFVPPAVPEQEGDCRFMLEAKQDAENNAPDAAQPVPPAPPLPNHESWQQTAWGGALFWLGRIPPGVMDEDSESSAALPHLLRALARCLGVPDDDAAMRAFCADRVPEGETPAAQLRRAREMCAAWENWLAEAVPDLPEPRMASVCQRSGRIRFEPGWIELHLPMDCIDTRIRRIGLDLDPGWLPWLGAVLRIRYE